MTQNNFMQTRQHLARRLLQIAVIIGGAVPVSAGLAGIVFGSGMLDGSIDTLSLDSHYRYMSGLLLGIGIGFWSTVPQIEKHTTRFQLLAAIVVLGGLARLYALIVAGVPNDTMLFGLCMELVVVPLLTLWQSHVARH